MEFHILGPLEVRANGELLSLGGPKQRALLAILLLSANRVVSRDRLVDELVGYQSRATVDHNLRVQISRLRKALASGGAESRLVTQSPGYLLRVEPEELDLDIFERHFSEGRSALESGDAESAAVTLREAESLWRGRPLADLEFEPFVRFDIERLEELHLLPSRSASMPSSRWDDMPLLCLSLKGLSPSILCGSAFVVSSCSLSTVPAGRRTRSSHIVPCALCLWKNSRSSRARVSRT
jgi:DNA-binding winged helix-turn-helix (wHTH) protein